MQILGTDRNVMKGNTIVNTGLSGIFVTAKRNVIQGNTIDQSGSRGIFLSQTEGVIIKDNIITRSELGIQISAGTTNTVVIGNIAGNNVGDISVQGEDPITAGNVFGN